MNVILIPDNRNEALEALNSGRAWSALRRIGELARTQQKHGNREGDWKCLDEVRYEFFEAMAVLGEDV